MDFKDKIALGNLEKAQAYDLKVHLNEVDKDGKILPLPLSTDIKTFGDYGVGLKLYFVFMQ